MREKKKTHNYKLKVFSGVAAWCVETRNLRSLYIALSSTTLHFSKQCGISQIRSIIFLTFFHSLAMWDLHCNQAQHKFHSTFSNDNLSDIDVDVLFSKLRVLQFVLPTKTMSTIDILKFVEFDNCHLNASTAYRVLLTVSATAASAKRNFSKLKFIKTLRSSMSREKLNGLTTLSIEKKNMLEDIDICVINYQ
jgi:hypothetical protein